MKVSARQYAQALYGALKDPNGRTPKEIIENFIGILPRRIIFGKSEKIIHDFTEYYNKEEGILKISVTTRSGDLDKGFEKTLVLYLEKKFGKKIEIEKKKDAGILGGIIIGYDDVIIDGSMKRQLEMLKKKLIT